MSQEPARLSPSPATLDVRPSERLCAWSDGRYEFAIDLRDQGTSGVEARVLRDGEVYFSQMFQDLPEHGIVARAVVALWADVQRDMLGGAPVFD